MFFLIKSSQLRPFLGTIYGGDITTNATGGAESGDSPPYLQDKIDRLRPDNDFEIKLNDILLKEAIKFIRENPRQDLFLTIKKFLIFWTYDPTYTPKIANKLVGASHLLYLIPWFIVIAFFSIGLFKNNIEKSILILFYIYFILSTYWGWSFLYYRGIGW